MRLLNDIRNGVQKGKKKNLLFFFSFQQKSIEIGKKEGKRFFGFV